MRLSELISDIPIGDVEVIGNIEIEIKGISEMLSASRHDITFAIRPEFIKKLDKCVAGAVIVPANVDTSVNESVTFIKVQNPYLFWAKCIKKFSHEPKSSGVINPMVSISESAEIEDNVEIGSFCVLEDNTKVGANSILKSNVFVGKNSIIGKNTVIYPNVVIREGTIIGNNCIIHPGVIIGGDGFGFAENDGEIVKIPQIGNVEIGHNVEIGSNSTIDRAVVGTTFIGDNTKIDNLVQIAHNVKIGKNCFIVAQSGISGSAELGNSVKLAGQSGVVGHLKIGDNAIIAARGVVMNDVPPGKLYSGFPARDHKDEMKVKASLKKLPEIVKLFFKLKKSELGKSIYNEKKKKND